VRNLEFRSNLGEVDIPALVDERRIARDDPQLRDLREQVQDLLGDAVAR
jgi:hypothetical protein